MVQATLKRKSSLDKQKEQEKIKAEGIDPEEKRKLQDELKATFGLS